MSWQASRGEIVTKHILKAGGIGGGVRATSLGTLDSLARPHHNYRDSCFEEPFDAQDVLLLCWSQQTQAFEVTSESDLVEGVGGRSALDRFDRGEQLRSRS